MNKLFYIISMVLAFIWTVGMFLFNLGITIATMIGISLAFWIMGLLPDNKKRKADFARKH